MSVISPPRTPVPEQEAELEALIKEARDRQRRRRRRVALAFAVAAAGAAIGYGIDHGGGNSSPAGAKPGASPSPPSTPRQRQQQLAEAAAKTAIGDAALIAPAVGWAMNGSALWLTTNAGRDWRLITPPALKGQDVIARVADVDFLDAKHGWLSAELQGNVSVNGSLRYGGISITSDGGKSWRVVTLPGCYQCANTYLSFVDEQHGYALAHGASARARPIKRLYSTSDGGNHWQLVRPMSVFGSILFTDERHGWLINDPSAWKQAPYGSIAVGEGTVYRTVDGGQSWQRVTLPAPRGYEHERQIATWMRFFDGRDGVIASLALDRVTKRLRVLVDVTSDRGTTWAVRAAPVSSEQPRTRDGLPYAAFSASSPHDWMLFSRMRPLLFGTSNGGRSWTTVPTTPHGKPASVWAADFVTPDEGWAIFLAGNLTAVLVRTTDGGRTWTPLTPPQPKVPPIPTPAKVCGSSCQRP